MKCNSDLLAAITGIVAPFAGAWIEIMAVTGKIDRKYVAPFAGAWIEIDAEMAD